MNEIKTKNQKDNIDYLKAFAITLVVTHHVITYANMIDLYPVMETLLNLIKSIHVPLFFCIAGYFCHQQNLKNFYRKKIERIIFPFVTFSSLKLIYTTYISNEFAHVATLPEQLIDAFLYGELYWFIYPMFIFYLFAPFFWKSKHVNILLFIALIIINCYLGNPTFNLLQLGAALFHACFFVAGILIQQYEKQLSALVKKCNGIFILACLTIITYITYLLYTKQVYHSFIVKFLLAFTEMYLAWRMSKRIPQNITILKVMGKYSLQIMFFDSFYKVILFMLLSKLAIKSLTTSLLTIPVNIFLCCISCFIIKKYLLFGIFSAYKIF